MRPGRTFPNAARGGETDLNRPVLLPNHPSVPMHRARRCFIKGTMIVDDIVFNPLIILRVTLNKPILTQYLIIPCWQRITIHHHVSPPTLQHLPATSAVKLFKPSPRELSISTSAQGR